MRESQNRPPSPRPTPAKREREDCDGSAQTGFALTGQQWVRPGDDECLGFEEEPSRTEFPVSSMLSRPTQITVRPLLRLSLTGQQWT
jgi:hypothetical protein